MSYAERTFSVFSFRAVSWYPYRRAVDPATICITQQQHRRSMAHVGDKDVGEILRSLTRHINCLSEENRNARKRALENIKKETIGRSPKLEPTVLQDLLRDIFKPVLMLVSDPVEKCREVTIMMISDALSKVPEPQSFLQYIIPVLVQRLGQQEIIEVAEELRLQLVNLLFQLVNDSGKDIAPYLDDLIQILQITIVDPFSEVRKVSCKCSSKVAKTIPEYFHMQSATLMKPLLTSISHQHSRVRMEVVIAIGDVIQFGSGKSVEDAVSHLAQRLFDQSPVVREAVIQVVGTWLLDLQDRYSFHNKLIPLLLSGKVDELPGIREKSDALWHDVGMKYEQENEEELKDKQDLLPAQLAHYPAGVERPNIGCRTLVYRHFSNIINGILNDMGDWVPATRVKSAQLLYVLMLNEENNMTQHLDKVVRALCRGSVQEEQEVVKQSMKCSELVGYFITPNVWCPIVMSAVTSLQSAGSLMVLTSVIRGSEKSNLQPHVVTIINAVADPSFSQSGEAAVQIQVLRCVQALLDVSKEDVSPSSLQLLTLLLTVLSLQQDIDIAKECRDLVGRLASVQGHDGPQQLYQLHARQVLETLQLSHETWTQYSTDRHLFDTLLMESGPVVGDLLDLAIPIIRNNVHPDKDPQVRLAMFTLLSRLVTDPTATAHYQRQFTDHVVTVVEDMVLPNCVWKAGRAAGTIRTTAVSCLWALLQGGMVAKEKMETLFIPLTRQLCSLLDDDNRSTRLVTCRVLAAGCRLLGRDAPQDFLHNIYPDLLKRMDDSSDDVRLAMCATLRAYLASFARPYDVALYRAHVESIYRGLLIHMDDADPSIQDAVCDVVKDASWLSPDMLLKELDSVKHKHRSTALCDNVQQFVRNLPKPE